LDADNEFYKNMARNISMKQTLNESRTCRKYSTEEAEQLKGLFDKYESTSTALVTKVREIIAARRRHEMTRFPSSKDFISQDSLPSLGDISI